MKIIDHQLYRDDGAPYPFKPSPNTGSKLQTPYYVVIHYTAGPNANHAVNWLTNPASGASAHLVIGRDGAIAQLVRFDTIAWHAGTSSWDGLSGLNKYSIGIELDNAGPLSRVGDQWAAWFCNTYSNDQVIEAVHKNRTALQGWQMYTPEQLFTALKVCMLLVEHYQLRDILGHDDIAPQRKTDPGPAFPMESFRSRLFGRASQDDDAPVIYQTTSLLNIRSGPGAEYPQIQGSPLPKGARLTAHQVQGNWRFVEVLDNVNGMVDLEGWVQSRYIMPEENIAAE